MTEFVVCYTYSHLSEHSWDFTNTGAVCTCKFTCFQCIFVWSSL